MAICASVCVPCNGKTIGLINGFELCKFRWLAISVIFRCKHLLLHFFNCSAFQEFSLTEL